MRALVCLMLVGCGAEAASGLNPALQARYDGACANCHETGAADAPPRWCQEDWERRRERGFDVLMERVKLGTTAMPPRGLCYDCSDAELEALVRHVSGWR